MAFNPIIPTHLIKWIFDNPQPYIESTVDENSRSEPVGRSRVLDSLGSVFENHRIKINISTLTDTPVNINPYKIVHHNLPCLKNKRYQIFEQINTASSLSKLPLEWFSIYSANNQKSQKYTDQTLNDFKNDCNECNVYTEFYMKKMFGEKKINITWV